MVLLKSERNPGPNTKSNEFNCLLLGFELSGEFIYEYPDWNNFKIESCIS